MVTGLSSIHSSRRVLHISTVHAPFDVRIFEKEARALAAAGYEVSVAMTVERETKRDGVAVLALGAFGGPKLRRVMRNLRAFPLAFKGYDLIHVHDPELLLLGSVATLCGRKVIYDVHEFYRKSYSRMQEESRWLGKFRPIISSLYNALEDFILPRLAGLVVVTPSMRDMYRGRIADDRLALVRNLPSIDDEVVQKARATPGPLNRPYILHTGGVSRIRAFHVIVDAAERLAASGSDAVIVNVGVIHLDEYPAAQRKELLERAERAGMVMTGRVSYEELLRWHAHASIGYLPLSSSVNNEEAYPTKLFEYFAFGLPVVASDIGETAKLMRTHGAGLLVPPDDGAAHGQAFIQLLGDRRQAAEHAERASLAATSYTFASEAQALITLYRRALA